MQIDTPNFPQQAVATDNLIDPPEDHKLEDGDPNQEAEPYEMWDNIDCDEHVDEQMNDIFYEVANEPTGRQYNHHLTFEHKAKPTMTKGTTTKEAESLFDRWKE